jgi:hypothetical protein
MIGLPECYELVKVRGCSVENLLHVRAFGVGWADGVPTVCLRYVTVLLQVNDDLRLPGKAVEVTWRMIVRVGDEADALEPQRTHGEIIT